MFSCFANESNFINKFAGKTTASPKVIENYVNNLIENNQRCMVKGKRVSEFFSL